MNSKFKMELRAHTEEQLLEWVEFLLAKRSLFSVDELLVDLTKKKLCFKTVTFQSLMVLREKDQNKWILDRLDEAFEGATGWSPPLLRKGAQSHPDPLPLIRAARKVVAELKELCAECEAELGGRNPKVSAHCRHYIRRHAQIARGRLSLELLAIPGTNEQRFEGMGEAAICAAIDLMAEIEGLRAFPFLPPDTVTTINSTLFNVGQLISALLNLSLHRVDAFFAATLCVECSLRPKKLLDIQNVLSESLQLVSVDTEGENSSSLATVIMLKVLSISFLFAH
jgi:hypothetical protein